jgi:acylphosphatase
MDAAAQLRVSGLVQGVGFRYYVIRKANALGIKGWVRNLYNGDVEIVAEGDRLVLESFISEVRSGPRAAWVKEVDIHWKDFQGAFSGFEIR